MDEQAEPTRLVFYDGSGRIAMVYVGCAPDATIAANTELSYIEGTADLSADYVDTTQQPPVVAARPTLLLSASKTSIQADGVDSVEVAGVPAPCFVSVYGPVKLTQEVADGSVAFTADIPGKYLLAIGAWPYLPWVQEIDAY